jgi:hypothetical protein
MVERRIPVERREEILAAPRPGGWPEEAGDPKAVHARELRDRLRGGQPQRALAQAVEQRRCDLRVPRHLRREAPVEHRQGQWREHAPDGAHRQQSGMARGLPRADEIARAEQFHAPLVTDQQLAREHAAHDQQADVLGRRAGEARHIPRPDRQPVRAHDQLALRLLAPCDVQQRAEIGIDIEQSDLRGSRHRQGASSVSGNR